MIRRINRFLTRTLDAIKVSRRIAPLYSPLLWRMVRRANKLYRTRRFAPIEAFRLGLLHPQCPCGAEAGFVSRWEMTKVQKALNPESLEYMLKDKGVFYRHCISHGLPIPKLYALIMPGGAGWCADGSSPTSRQEWANRFSSTLPNEFIIKPIRGTVAEGFDILTRCDGGFRDTKGRRWTADALAERLLQKTSGDGWVLQERLKSHPDICRLSGVEYLQCIRIVTLIDKQGNCRIILGEMRMIVDERISDNEMVDMSGSTELPINLTDGRTGAGIHITGDGLGPHTYTHHPKTHLPLVGFQVPRWNQACELVSKAAIVFLPIRTIGWDVAVTPEGLYLVEGNIWWNNGKKHAGFRQVIDFMRQQT